MKNKFGILEVFNYVDGRLATSMESVYQLAEAYTKSKGVTTLGLIVVADKIKQERPQWFIDAEEIIKDSILVVGSSFDKLKDYLVKNYSHLEFEIK